MDRFVDDRSRLRDAMILGVAGVVSCAGYWWLTFRLRADGSAADVWSFLGLMTALFAVYFGMVAWTHRRTSLGTRTILGFALLFRLLLLPAGLSPDTWWDDLEDDVTSSSGVAYRGFLLYDNDVWRYLWDGHVASHGFDPYRDTPQALEVRWEDGDPAAAAAFEDDAWQDVFDYLSYRDYRSIYPPLAQALFRGVHAVAPGSVFVWKLVLVVFDFATCCLLVLLLRRFGRPPEAVLLYAWNPLAIKEIAGSGHIDAVMIFCLVLAIHWTTSGKTRLGLLAFGLSVLSKLTPILLVGLFLRRAPWRQWWILAATLVAGFLPFVSSWGEILRGLAAFASEWMFNPGLWAVWRWIAEAVGLPGRPVASATSALLTVAVILWVLRRDTAEADDLVRGSFLILATYLVLSATVMPWYLLWVVPLAAIRPGVSWLLLTWLSLLSYLIYIDQIEHPVWLWIEYSVFFAAVIWEWTRPRERAREASRP